jgi:hypothetical protein
MLKLINSRNLRCRRWGSFVVLLAVLSLTVSVTTRYSFSHDGSSPAANQTAHKTSPQDQVRQRLLKNADTWMPPVVCVIMLEAPVEYPRIAPVGPPVADLFFEKNLYNRPPPILNPYLL